MHIVRSPDPSLGIEALATRISDALNAGKPVLWLVCGGSNIPIAVQAMERVRVRTEAKNMPLLTVGLTDERYGPVGHADSNWQQLADLGFNLAKVSKMPVLIEKALESTAEDYAKALGERLEEVHSAGGVAVALFGIGADGHIAGILPNSPAADSTALAAGYGADPFIRVTMTFDAIRKIDTAYAFVFGGAEKKAPALQRLINETIPLKEQPAQILKELAEANLYTDIIG